jgi:hypothetical protein
VLSTIAANHTKALAADHGATSALIGGYQLAFLAGAVVIGAGIVLAFVLLRPRDSRLELQVAPGSAGDDGPHAPTNFEIEEQAA